MATTFKLVDAIDAESWEGPEPLHTQKAKLMTWWLTISRYVRRMCLRGRRSMAMAFSRLPRWLQRGLVLTAMVVGYVIAWMTVYLTIVIAFVYGLGWGLATVFIWCTIAAAILEA